MRHSNEVTNIVLGHSMRLRLYQMVSAITICNEGDNQDIV